MQWHAINGNVQLYGINEKYDLKKILVMRNHKQTEILHEEC